MHNRSHDQGGLHPRDLCPGFSVQGVSVQGGFCPGGVAVQSDLYGNERVVCILLECILVFLPPPTKLGKVMFSQACVILFTGGCASVHAGIPPGSRHPPGTRHPPGADTPRCRACWEIRSSRGRYASYWNAILF